jgi:phosphatidylserine/phosphatidylglycerophosphate/cardiolipin synthase-like enzyme
MAKGVKVSIMTRPAADESTATDNLLGYMKTSGLEVITKPNIHQKFAIIDQRVVWYGSINLLSYGNSEESIMRFVSRNIAVELLKTVLAEKLD